MYGLSTVSSSCVIETMWEGGHRGHETSKYSQEFIGRIRHSSALVFHMLLLREYDHRVLISLPGETLAFLCTEKVKRSGGILAKDTSGGGGWHSQAGASPVCGR